MAKKKPGQTDKVFPKVGQEWRETSGEVEHLLFVERVSQDSDRKQTWDCEDQYVDEDGKVKKTVRTLYLADFSEPFMQLVADPEASLPPPEPEIMIEPTKKGFNLVCPSPSCGDKHPMENSAPWSEVVAARDRFYARHRDHMTEGTLFGGQS
jgi:hypothetical protein